MSYTILHDTGLAAVADRDKVTIYVQLSNGSLGEATSSPNGNWNVSPIQIPNAPAPKLYTPLVVLIGKNQQRHLFYIEGNNYLSEAVYKDKDSGWSIGTLRTLGIIPAQYSKIAAAKPFEGNDQICVFYQVPNMSGAIRQVTWNGTWWTQDTRDLGDDVLTGTGLAAVGAELGTNISNTKTENPPVVFFQQSNLDLAWLQDTSTRKINDVDPTASPHTPLAATGPRNENLDIGSDLFYTSDQNVIQSLAVDELGKKYGIDEVTATTPKGNLAAVVAKKRVGTRNVDQVIVIYQGPGTEPQSQSVPDGSTKRDTGACLYQTSYIVTKADEGGKLARSEFEHALLRFE
ncbi:Fucose-specific lectin [Metarhizium brunneum]|uniref:Fucose-specific lectin n=1 Tax=Metarhizium brunneum TaxID=500148 RepID=A0A7D5YWL4_9HYPO